MNAKDDIWYRKDNLMDTTYTCYEKDYDSPIGSENIENQNVSYFNNTYRKTSSDLTDYDELPLLEELEIYPDRILEKTLAILNSFRIHSKFTFENDDLAGPVGFCVALALCLFLSGSKAHFGYIYGLSVISCLLMYFLLTLMTASNEIFTIRNVASTLGYCLLPIVGLSFIKIFISINDYFGILLTVLAVLWCSLSASQVFVAMSGDTNQRELIAYPCLLVYGVFALIIVF